MHNDVELVVDAVESGDVERVTRVLDEHRAAFHGHRSIVNLLIARGADVNARDGEHDATPSG